MHRIAATLAIVIVLIFSAVPAWADYNDGWAAVERGDYATAVKEFLPLAKQGNADAQYNLAILYTIGEGVPQNHVQALEWLSKAAEQDHVKAQYNLGLMYYQGTGVPKNNTLALKWYRKAAESSFAPAQFNLGVMYANGDGVPRNFVRAYMWWSLASALDDKSAARALDQIIPIMTPAQLAKGKALATNWKQASSQFDSKKEKQNDGLDAERKALNQKLTKIIMGAINWSPFKVTEGTLDNPGPPISQTCPPDMAKRIQEVSEEEFTSLVEQISGDLASEISGQITDKLGLSQAQLSLDALVEFSSWSEEEQKAFQKTDLAKRIQQLVLPEITQSLKTVRQKFEKLAPGIFKQIEARLETEGITKVSEHNWCLKN